MNVALFITCYHDTLFPQVGQAMVAVLERLGHRVVFPSAQTCCGQMHLNTGYQREIIPLARHFIDTFHHEDFDAIVAPSASCVASIQDFYPKLAALSQDTALARDVDAITPRVFEFSQFLVDVLGVCDVGAYYPHCVTYHPTCHGLRMLKVGQAPMTLLEHVRGLTLVPLPEATTCCGFGGTFAIKNAETSVAMLSDKISNILSTGAEQCVAIDRSCLMHIEGGLHRQRTGVDTIHLAEILASTDAA